MKFKCPKCKKSVSTPKDRMIRGRYYPCPYPECDANFALSKDQKLELILAYQASWLPEEEQLLANGMKRMSELGLGYGQIAEPWAGIADWYNFKVEANRVRTHEAIRARGKQLIERGVIPFSDPKPVGNWAPPRSKGRSRKKT